MHPDLYSPECVEKKTNSRKLAVTSEARYGLKQLHTSVLKVPPAQIEGYLVTGAARDCYEPLRLATTQLSENFQRVALLPGRDILRGVPALVFAIYFIRP